MSRIMCHRMPSKACVPNSYDWNPESSPLTSTNAATARNSPGHFVSLVISSKRSRGDRVETSALFVCHPERAKRVEGPAFSPPLAKEWRHELFHSLVASCSTSPHI